jgi:hypothetical protein
MKRKTAARQGLPPQERLLVLVTLVIILGAHALTLVVSGHEPSWSVIVLSGLLLGTTPSRP